MIQYTPKMGSKRLYVGEIQHPIDGGSSIRAVFAKTPTEAVQVFKQIYPESTAWVSRLRVLVPERKTKKQKRATTSEVNP